MEKSQPRGDDHDDRPKEKATDVSLPNNSRRESKNTIDKNLKRKSTEIENQVSKGAVFFLGSVHKDKTSISS